MMRSLAAVVAALCAASAAANPCETWFERTAHGQAFRNVTAYGAVGDGVHDDTSAFLAALEDGREPKYTIRTPTIVYVPPGRYLVSQTLPLWMRTQLVGNYKCRPTIVLAPGSSVPYVVRGSRRLKAAAIRSWLAPCHAPLPPRPFSRRFPPRFSPVGSTPTTSTTRCRT